MPAASKMAKTLEEFVAKHVHAATADMVLLPLEATQLAALAEVASDKV